MRLPRSQDIISVIETIILLKKKKKIVNATHNGEGKIKRFEIYRLSWMYSEKFPSQNFSGGRKLLVTNSNTMFRLNEISRVFLRSLRQLKFVSYRRHVSHEIKFLTYERFRRVRAFEKSIHISFIPREMQFRPVF